MCTRMCLGLCGFSRDILTDKADSVVAENCGRQVLDYGLCVVGEAYVFQFGNEFSRTFPFVDGQLDVALAFAALHAFATQLFEPPHAPFIACAAGFDALADPDFRSEEHTSELQSLMRISYAVFCLKKKNQYLIQ